MSSDMLAVLVLVFTFGLGIRSTWRLRRIHHSEKPPRNRITAAFYRTALTITLAAGFFGLLSARRVLGFETIPGISIVSLLISSVVLLIPLFLDLSVQNIRKAPNEHAQLEAQADRLELAVAENTRISQQASDNADAAYQQANTINLKLEAQGREILAEADHERQP